MLNMVGAMRKFLPQILILSLIGGGAYYWFKYRPAHAQQEIKLFGNVEIREAEAAFRQSGRIKDLLVEEGDKVQEGQLIAELETDTFMDAMKSSDAEIAMANSDLSKLKNGSRPEEIAIAQDQVAQAKAVLANAQNELARQQSLVPSGAVAQKIVDNLNYQRDIAQANLNAAIDALKLRQNGARKEDIATGQARLDAAKANRQKLNTALDDTKLYAPVAGIIVAKPKEKGSIIAPNLAVYTISIQDPIYIRAYVKEGDLAKFSPGSQVLIKSDSIEKEYQGQVGYVSPRAEFTPKTVETQDLRSDLVYRLRIIVKSPDGKLLQGMPVTVRLGNAPR